jgi:AraC-like DNA-binding protein
LISVRRGYQKLAFPAVISWFRNQQRLQRFLRLYGTGRRTTALAAALEAGFGSYAQFYRVFRQQAGRSPSALRTAATDDHLNLGRDIAERAGYAPDVKRRRRCSPRNRAGVPAKTTKAC